MPTAGNPRFVALGDFDGDGKTDLAVANQQSASVSVWRNIATPGTLNAGSFSARTDYPTLAGPQHISIGDLNGDNKPDLVVACFGSKGLSILRNTSTQGSLNNSSFAPRTTLITDGDFFVSSLGDVNGDGTTDIVAPKLGSFGRNEIMIWSNTGAGGEINTSSFATVGYPVAGYLLYSAIADLDGDGGPELAAVSASDNRVSLLKLPAPVRASVPAITALSPFRGPVGSQVTIRGLNFNPSSNSNIVYFGGVKATVLAASDTSLTVTVPPGTTYEPVSVLNTGTSLTGYSAQPFTTTFANPRPGGFNAGFYASRRDFPQARKYPYGLALGDIDGDGKPDLLTANTDFGTISAQLNKSTPGRIDDNSFGPQVYFTADDPFSVLLKDLDGDGKLDALSLTLNSSKVLVYRNTASPGTLSFTNPFNLAQTSGSLAYSLASGDLDNDGRPDIVFVNATNNVVTILKNISTPGSLDVTSFSAKINLATGAFPRSVSLADIDGDGKVDIIVANYNDNTLSVFRNTGTQGTLTTASFAPHINFSTGTEPSGLAKGDVDGDGKTDIIVVNHGSNSLSVFRNTATSGSITAASLAPKMDFATGSQPYALTITDADGDGKPDLLTANSAAGTVSVLQNTATAGAVDASSFAPKVDFPGAGYLISLAAGDIDGDGVPEVLTGNASTNPNYVSVLSTAANGAALPADAPLVTSISPATAPVGAPVTISGSKFNADAAANTVYFGSVKAQVTSGTTSSLTVTVPAGSLYKSVSVLNTANGLSGSSARPFSATYVNPNAYYGQRLEFNAGATPRDVAIGDLDGDGKPDLVVANGGASSISVLRNTSTSGPLTAALLAPKIDLPLDAVAFTVVLGDVDGDGKLDVIAGSNSSMVSVFRNISSPGALTTASFAPKADFAVGSRPISIAVSDLDLDGKPDLAVSNNGSATISVLRNTAMQGSITAGSFDPKVDFPSYRAGNIEARDMDGDGKPDLLQTYQTGAARYDGSLAVLRNTSSTGRINAGSFSSPIIFQVNNAAGPFSVFDIDGDDKPDVALSTPGEVTKVKLLRNNSTPGAISLTDADGLPGDVGMAGHAVGDLNGDGKPDLVIANFLNQIVYSFINKATPGTVNYQSLGYGSMLPGAYGPLAAAIGDLDGDGYPEIITANSSAASTISVFHINTPAGSVAASGGGSTPGVAAAEAAKPELQVFPNPTRDEFTLLLPGLNTSAGSIEILNANGKLVDRRTLGTGVQLQRLSLRKQPAGTYYVKVTTTKGIQVAKVVITR